MNEYMAAHHKPAPASYPSSPAVVLPPTPQQVTSPPPQYSADSPPAGARASSKAGRKPARKVSGASSARRTTLATPKESSFPSAPLSRIHPDLDPHSRIDVAPTQDVLFLRDKKKPNTPEYLHVTVTNPRNARLVAVTLARDGADEIEDPSVAFVPLKGNQFMVLLDTSTLYNKAGVQVMRLRLIDLEQRVVAQQDFHYVVHSKSTQRPDMFYRVAMRELQQIPTWEVAWKWISRFYAKRCYRDLTGKQKAGAKTDQPLPSEDIVLSIHRLTPSEEITPDIFQRLIAWTNSFYALYNTADVQALMESSLLHFIPPSRVEKVLKEASELTGRPTFLLRFSSQPDALALNLYKGRLQATIVRIYDPHSDKALRAALNQIIELLKQPEQEGTLALHSIDRHTDAGYRTCDVKLLEETIKQLKCMKDHSLKLPHGYENNTTFGTAVNELAGGKRKHIEPASPAVGSPYGAHLPSEEEAEEELDHGQVLRPDAAGGAAHSAQATVETLYAQAMANEEVGRSLYELLRRQFGGLSLSPFVEGEDMESPYMKIEPLQLSEGVDGCESSEIDNFFDIILSSE